METKDRYNIQMLENIEKVENIRKIYDEAWKG